MSSDYEELDSFTLDLIKRNEERQRLLNDETTDVSSELSSNHSQSSLRSHVLLNDNKNNIKHNESPDHSVVADPTSKQVIENLSKMLADGKRAPLNQRLNSIARTYTYEDSDDIEYMDESHINENIRPKNEFIRSPTKPMRQTPTTPLESPPKKRLLLNQRLNQMARYYDSEEFESNNFNSPKEVSSVAQSKAKTGTSAVRQLSPTKKFTLPKNLETTEDQYKEPVVETKRITQSPVKKQIITEEKISSKPLSPNKTTDNKSPIKKQSETTEVEKKLTTFGFQKTEPSVKPKSILNSSDNKKVESIDISSPNVSAVRNKFEQIIKQKETKVDRPEILPLRAKADLFEKAILAENEAKSKQYHRKRIAPQIKTIDKPNGSVITNNGAIASDAVTSGETAIKKQKSCEKLIQTKTSVANNIRLRKQQLEEKLFNNTENSTANAYKKELENRQKEIDLLKRPLRPEPQELTQVDEKQVIEEEIQQIEQKSEEVQSVDDETAHQTVCEAFEDIENYVNEESDDDSFNENLNSGADSYKSESINDKKLNIESQSPTKNRLYPQLFPETDELCGQSHEEEVIPPEKPPRVYQNPETNTTPLRTISFYRREQTLKLHKESQKPAIEVVFKGEDKPSVANFDLAERNRKIQEQIDELKEKVDQVVRMAGQASQALNLCLERDEFKGSTERVEAEKVLLLSGQKRIAFLNEIQRLKVKLNDKKPDPIASKGLLTLSDFKLPVKGEFMVSRAKGSVPEIHHLIGLLNTAGNVVSTNLLNTEKDIKNGTLEFDFGIRGMHELTSDFQMVVHIYDLITSKQQLSHELKYHIKKTPKKNKSSMKSPTVRSPGGPDAVLSTSFRLIGSVVINLTNYDKNCFRLENFDFNCPLEGTLRLKSEMTVRHPFHKEGFFNVGDKGLWNMRWAVLKGNRLAFWRFPEDAQNKPALNVFDLKHCINPKISSIPYHLNHICARRNTIAMIIFDNNGQQNIFSKGGSLPRSRPSKLLMNAENKEKCVEWSDYLTTVLNNIRVWDVDAVKPYSEEEFEKLLMSLE